MLIFVVLVYEFSKNINKAIGITDWFKKTSIEQEKMIITLFLVFGTTIWAYFKHIQDRWKKAWLNWICATIFHLLFFWQILVFVVYIVQ